jgi:hypothetical protein
MLKLEIVTQGGLAANKQSAKKQKANSEKSAVFFLKGRGPEIISRLPNQAPRPVSRK